MFNHLANYVVAASKHVMAGLPVVTDEVYYARLSLCGECPMKQDGWVCSECGCDLLTKARWAEQECGMKPESGNKKWLAYDDQPPPTAKSGCCG